MIVRHRVMIVFHLLLMTGVMIVPHEIVLRGCLHADAILKDHLRASVAGLHEEGQAAGPGEEDEPVRPSLLPESGSRGPPLVVEPEQGEYSFFALQGYRPLSCRNIR